MDEQIHLKDESNDRSYFTIIPNYILNHSTAVAQALYLQLKRLAGERGEAYPGNQYLMEKLGVSKPTLRKEYKYLLDKGWIKYNGLKEVKTDGGLQKVKSYRIVDLWQLNNEHYKQSQRGEKIDHTLQRGEKIDPQGGKTRGEKIDHKEDPLKQDPSFKKEQILADKKSAHAEIMKFYSDMVQSKFGFKPKIDAADGKLLKSALSMGVENIRALVEWYLDSDKCRELEQVSLSACLSKDSINKWRLSASKPKRVAFMKIN